MGHASHRVPPAPSSGVRAKTLSRTDLASRCLEDAMRATGTANTALAALLGVDERIVRDIRSGARALTVDRLIAAGSVGAAALRAAAEVASPPARRGAAPEQHGLAVARHAGALAGVVEQAVADGVVSLDEKRAIRGAALAGRAAYDALLADLGND